MENDVDHPQHGDNAAQVVLKSQYDLPKEWVILADASEASDQAITTFDKEDMIPPRSAMVLVDKESYDAINQTDKVDN